MIAMGQVCKSYGVAQKHADRGKVCPFSVRNLREIHSFFSPCRQAKTKKWILSPKCPRSFLFKRLSLIFDDFFDGQRFCAIDCHGRIYRQFAYLVNFR